jgi:citrate lyase subunit beta/citryl-CoA lyase
MPLIESAAGLWNARAIAEAPGVLRLAFGSIDFQLDLGITDDDLIAYRAALVLASRVAGRIAPVERYSIDDTALVQRDVERARALGFGSWHPSAGCDGQRPSAATGNRLGRASLRRRGRTVRRCG